jgi:hypothetical protein
MPFKDENGEVCAATTLRDKWAGVGFAEPKTPIMRSVDLNFFPERMGYPMSPPTLSTQPIALRYCSGRASASTGIATAKISKVARQAAAADSETGVRMMCAQSFSLGRS